MDAAVDLGGGLGELGEVGHDVLLEHLEVVLDVVVGHLVRGRVGARGRVRG